MATSNNFNNNINNTHSIKQLTGAAQGLVGGSYVTIGSGAGYTIGGASILGNGAGYSGVGNFSIGGIPSPKISIGGEDLPRGDAFSALKTLYPSDFVMNGVDSMHRHFCTWRTLNKEIQDYGVLYDSGNGAIVVFNSEDSLKDFTLWIENFKDTFFEGDTTKMATYHYPQMPEAKTVTGTTVSNQKFGLAEAWEKIVSRCKHPVYMMQVGWFFTDLDEAVHFRML
jgi:hypothetical protein